MFLYATGTQSTNPPPSLCNHPPFYRTASIPTIKQVLEKFKNFAIYDYFGFCVNTNFENMIF
jgi:hypothetical protein